MSKLKGMGGHMTAALLHDIDVLYRIYDHKIRDAWSHNKSTTADDLAKQRDRQVRRIADRLAERGYTYVMQNRPAAMSKPKIDPEIIAMQDKMAMQFAARALVWRAFGRAA